ncbi:MAG: hypothetical protein DWQ44_11680 [Bacteroidetes bacterium]|nr:MAG: hypothetical protein DWQ33_10645 [Bacteroidota bacterium]REK05281.1 MAG: hypothetical protein DWQ39_08810 [Bacteroidota bacterium]REK32686.1 MAG: hypothetical protein DWQ44_11680 [Bacteroidota bacterium]REK48867.1 MAG: hypothetical protein DWQ48_08280 [Bacteroidota bacterium]
MKNLRNKILLIGVLVFLGAAAFGIYLYNKPHKSVRNITPVAFIDSSDLISEFESDEESANGKYLGKVVQVSGTVISSSIDKEGNLNVMLEGPDLAAVSCQFEKGFRPIQGQFSEGKRTSIKGFCTGILIDVVLVQCLPAEEKKQAL